MHGDEGTKTRRDLIEFGESVWYLKPSTAGKDKLDERWGDSVFLGNALVRSALGRKMVWSKSGCLPGGEKKTDGGRRG